MVIDMLYYATGLNPVCIGDEGKAVTGQVKSQKPVPGSETVEILARDRLTAELLHSDVHPNCHCVFTPCTLRNLQHRTVSQSSSYRLKRYRLRESSQHYGIGPDAQQEMLPNFSYSR
jgi:hypothetical protein